MSHCEPQFDNINKWHDRINETFRFIKSVSAGAFIETNLGVFVQGNCWIVYSFKDILIGYAL